MYFCKKFELQSVTMKKIVEYRKLLNVDKTVALKELKTIQKLEHLDKLVP